MSLKQYVKDAARTNATDGMGDHHCCHLRIDGQEDNDLHITKLQFNVLHMSIGIMTELIELEDARDEVNFLEEIGDCMWYIAGWIKHCKADIDLARDHNVVGHETVKSWLDARILAECRFHAGELLDRCKKTLYYGKDYDWELCYEHVCKILQHLDILAARRNRSLEQVCGVNIAKLRVRYPEKFTELDANNRDLDAEKKTLE